jgi:thioredoxin 1
MVGPILEELSNELSDKVTIAKHNIDENPNVPTKFGVRGIPTMLLFKDGELKSTKVGASTKSDLKSWIEQNL